MTFLWIYLIGYVLSFRPIFRHFYQEVGSNDWENICGSIALWVMVGSLWPLLFIGTCLKHTVGRCDPERIARLIGGESQDQKVKRKRKELRSLQEKMNRMERELL